MYNAGLHYRRMNIWHYENGFSRSKKEPATHYEPFLWFSNDKKKWTYNVDDVRKPTLPDNSTRLPIAFMKTCGWIESERSRSLYPPKSLECLRLTVHGQEVATMLHGVKD